MNLNSFLYLIVLTFTLAAININSSHAHRELNTSTPELARSSTDIVVAKCVSSETKLDDETGMIFTYTTFKIDENLKGKYGDEIVLRTVGGTVGDITVSSPFIPTFKQGEEVVLFLGPRNVNGYPVIQSISKGIYRVKSINGTKTIATPVNDLEIINSRTNQRMIQNSNILLDDFIYSLNGIL